MAAITDRMRRLATVQGDTVPEHRVQFGTHRHFAAGVVTMRLFRYLRREGSFGFPQQTQTKEDMSHRDTCNDARRTG